MKSLLYCVFIGAVLVIPVISSAAPYQSPVGIKNPVWGSLGSPIDAQIPPHPAGWPSSEVTKHFYVDPGHPNATDDKNSYGYPDKPRISLPGVFGSVMPAGTYMELHGDLSEVTKQARTTFDGTEESPCWVVGDALLNREWIIKGQYVIFDGLKGGNGMVWSLREHDKSTLHHICLRNGVCEGNGVASKGSVIGIYAASSWFEDIVIYNYKIHDYGDDELGRENDKHGILPNYNCRNVWILDCEIYNMGGDSVQVGIASIPDAARANHIYVGRGHFYHNNENSIDVKKAKDVILSENHCHDSFGTEIVIHDGPVNVWALMNKIHDNESAIICTGGSNVWSIGNLIYNIHHKPGGKWDPTSGYSAGNAFRYYYSSGGMVNNTIYNYDIGIQLPAGSDSGYTIVGNLFAGRAEVTGRDLHAGGSKVAAESTLDYNLYQPKDGKVNISWNGNYINLKSLQTGTGKEPQGIQTSQPGLIDPPRNMNLSAESPALNAGTEAEVYSQFKTLYGIDITGKSEPSGQANWDIGANLKSNPATAPSKVEGLRIKKVN